MDDDRTFSDGEDDDFQDDDNLEQQPSDNNSFASASTDESWISWFVGLKGNNFFCDVEPSYIQDDFNLTGLHPQVPYYEHALEMILDVELSNDKITNEQHDIIETAAEVLYGLIHARYILTAAGMSKMHEKYQNADFGRCPRTICQGQPVLPIGLSDVTSESAVEVFCPKCQEVYFPRSSRYANIDGAYFGTTFCHLFLLTHPELVVPKPTETYVPRIFGFRIHESSQYYQLRGLSGSRKKSNKSTESDKIETR